jgi:hypothetical protein
MVGFCSSERGFVTLSDRYAPGMMHISIASPPDREKLVAEIFYGREQWAELNTESDSLTIELYPRPTGDPWSFAYDSAVAALQEARRRLLGGAVGESSEP